MTRLILLVCGHVCLALGTIGIFLPVLPTVPFVLLASICYAKSSERLYQWLMNHPYFGPPLQEWKRTKSLPLPVKFLAISMIAVSAGFSIFVLIPIVWVKWLVGGICTSVAAYIAFGIPTRR